MSAGSSHPARSSISLDCGGSGQLSNASEAAHLREEDGEASDCRIPSSLSPGPPDPRSWSAPLGAARSGEAASRRKHHGWPFRSDFGFRMPYAPCRHTSKQKRIGLSRTPPARGLPMIQHSHERQLSAINPTATLCCTADPTQHIAAGLPTAGGSPSAGQSRP